MRLDERRAPARITRVPFEMRPGEVGTLLLLSDLATMRKVQTHLLEAGRFAVLGPSGRRPGPRDPQPVALDPDQRECRRAVSRHSPAREWSAVAESLETIKGETHRLADLLNNYLGMVRPREGNRLRGRARPVPPGGSARRSTAARKSRRFGSAWKGRRRHALSVGSPTGCSRRS